MKFRNNFELPVVLSYVDTDSNNVEKVISNGVEFNFESIGIVIIHNKLYDNMLRYKWIKAGYNKSFDIAEFSQDKIEIFNSDFNVEFVNGKVFFSSK